MEQENKNTFYKNVDEAGQSESFNDLRDYFKITEENKIVWIKNAPQKIIEHVEYLATKYLL